MHAFQKQRKVLKVVDFLKSFKILQINNYELIVFNINSSFKANHICF